MVLWKHTATTALLLGELPVTPTERRGPHGQCYSTEMETDSACMCA